MGDPPSGEFSPDGTEEQQNENESILIIENNIPFDLDHEEYDQWSNEVEVGARDENGFTWDEFIPESLDSIISDFTLNEVLEHTDSIISDFASDEILENTDFELNVSNNFHSLLNDGASELIDSILSESEENQSNANHYLNSTAHSSNHISNNTSNDSPQPTNFEVIAPLPASPGQDVIPTEERKNSWKTGDNPVCWSDICNDGMSHIYDDLPYSPDEDQAAMVGDRDPPYLSDIGGYVNLCEGTIPSVSHLTNQVGASEFPMMPSSTAVYPEINNGDNLLPDGDDVNMESSTSGNYSRLLQEGSHMNLTDTVTEVIWDSYLDGTMSSPESEQIPIDNLINGTYHSLPQITIPELEGIFAMSDKASAPSMQSFQPSLEDVGGHVDPLPSVNHLIDHVGISDIPNNGDHLIPDGDVGVESGTEEVNCDSNSIGDVLTTGSQQISTYTLINVIYHPLPQFANQVCLPAVGAQVQPSGTSDGAVPTVHQVENTSNPNNWNHGVIMDNNAQFLQLSTLQNSDEEKKRKRREQNRVNSRNSRERKRESVANLFEKEDELSRENASLKGEVERLSKEKENIKKDLEERKED